MSKMETKKVNITGLFSTLLLVAFIVLKLCNVITWSWWWVLAPLWVPIGLTLIFGGLFVWLGRK
jgi:hypothetical protein